MSTSLPTRSPRPSYNTGSAQAALRYTTGVPTAAPMASSSRRWALMSRLWTRPAPGRPSAGGATITWPSRRCVASCLPLHLLDLGDERGDDRLPVADEGVVRHLEDGGFRILVDGHDDLG